VGDFWWGEACTCPVQSSKFEVRLNELSVGWPLDSGWQSLKPLWTSVRTSCRHEAIKTLLFFAHTSNNNCRIFLFFSVPQLHIHKSQNISPVSIIQHLFSNASIPRGNQKRLSTRSSRRSRHSSSTSQNTAIQLSHTSSCSWIQHRDVQTQFSPPSTPHRRVCKMGRIHC
jgi:hypothetical protein